jgi:hypothetical protein
MFVEHALATLDRVTVARGSPAGRRFRIVPRPERTRRCIDDLWRAGHAHVGVLLVLSLVLLRYVDDARLPGPLRALRRGVRPRRVGCVSVRPLNDRDRQPERRCARR